MARYAVSGREHCTCTSRCLYPRGSCTTQGGTTTSHFTQHFITCFLQVFSSSLRFSFTIHDGGSRGAYAPAARQFSPRRFRASTHRLSGLFPTLAPRLSPIFSLPPDSTLCVDSVCFLHALLYTPRKTVLDGTNGDSIPLPRPTWRVCVMHAAGPGALLYYGLFHVLKASTSRTPLPPAAPLCFFEPYT